jgi:thiamine biosynthesis lipoprotein
MNNAVLQFSSASWRGLVIMTVLATVFSGSVTTLASGTENKQSTRHTFAEPHLGTFVRLIFYSQDERTAAKEKADRCFKRVRELDAVFSDYRDDSELTLLCQKAVQTPHEVSPELFAVLSFARKVSARSEGAFDITLGRDTKRWRARRDGKDPAHDSPQNERVSYRDLVLDPEKQTITLLKPLQLDLGGIAKGYIADQLLSLLRQSGIKEAAVIIGGEIVLADAPPGKDGWRIGLSNPEQKIIGSLVLTNTALSTSGDTYQFFEEGNGERRAHLIDPTSRKGKSNRLNVTTIAPTAMQADAWATALRILPTAQALEIAGKEPDLEACFIPLEGPQLKTPAFPEPVGQR